MALTINTNAYSLTAQRNLASTQSSLATSMQRLSSGLRINTAQDDAAGLAIAERLNSQIKGMNVAIRNANDGISMAQVADGTASQISDNLQRMRELAVQASNGSYASADRDNLNTEFTALTAEITRIAQGAKFNNISLTDSSATTAVSFQIGAGTATYNQISLTRGDLTAMSTGLNLYDSVTASAAISVAGSTNGNAQIAISQLDAAIDEVTTMRAGYGAFLNQANAAVSNLQNSVMNQSAARGRITDTDFATETANLSRSQILQQAGTAMLAQANAMPNNVLSLLK